MATLTTQIYEILTLDGNDVGSSAINTINGINNVDNRIVTVGTESWTDLFYFDPAQYPTYGATYSTGSFKYGRITNLSTIPVKILIAMYDNDTSIVYNTEQVITSGSSFTLSSAKGDNTNSTVPTYDDWTFGNKYISTISVAPSGSAATLEYYIATT